MARRKQRAGASRRGRPSALARISTADLRKELERRQSMLQDLLRQRDALSDELRELESIFGAGHAANGRVAEPQMPRRRGRPRGSGRRSSALAGPRRRRGRGPNQNSLVTSLQQTLKGKTMGVSEVTDAVQKNGYKTSSPNFRTIVNQALLANPDVFKKVARGQYTAR